MSVGQQSYLASAAWTVDVRSRARDYAQLVKLRLSSMVLMSAVVGYWLGATDIALGHLLSFTAGTFLIVAAANAFNQVLERHTDARMARTARRPIPSGRVSVREATALATVMGIAGTAVLFLVGGPLCGVLGLTALATYVVVYTPLKSRSSWSTLPGAISGAIPPLMGFAAASGTLGPGAWCLFGILFFWQFPHTWAIASTYRDDYAKAGYRALPVEGTQARTLVAAVALVMASFAPVALGLTGAVYLLGATALGVFFLVAATRFGNGTLRPRAVQLLVATLFYLPLVLALFAFDGRVV